MCTSMLKLFCLILIIKNLASADLPPNSRCRLVDNTPGLCIQIRKCKPVMDLINAGTIYSNPPTICSQEDQSVCCPIQGLLAVRSMSNRAEATTAASYGDKEEPKDLESKIGGLEEEETVKERISDKKCREYGQKVIYTVKIAPTLIGGNPHEIKVDRCKHKPVALIVGGTEAKPFEFPHQGLIGYGKRSALKWHCGCTLVSPRFALTAAHCLEVPTKNKILTPKAVKFGSISRFGDDTRTVIVDVEETFKYDDYTRNSSTVIGDLALLKLVEEVPLSEYILPVCLPTKQLESEKGIVTGFGITEDGILAQNLLKVTLERFSHSECQELWRNKTIDSNAMVCYGHHTEEKDSCRGDSGGPLVVSNADKVSCTYTQIGIVSFGLRQCGTIGFPGIYVNVYNYLDWIEGIVWKDEK